MANKTHDNRICATCKYFIEALKSGTKFCTYPDYTIDDIFNSVDKTQCREYERQQE